MTMPEISENSPGEEAQKCLIVLHSYYQSPRVGPQFLTLRRAWRLVRLTRYWDQRTPDLGRFAQLFLWRRR